MQERLVQIFFLLLTAVGIVVAWNEAVDSAAQYEQMTVQSRTWRRNIIVEEFRSVPQGEWCEDVPNSAYKVNEVIKIRTRECYNLTEKTRMCFVTMDDYCYFYNDEWAHYAAMSSNGNDTRAPFWRDVTIEPGQRIAEYREEYTVHFVNQSGRRYQCKFDQSTWATYNVGSQWVARVDAHGIRCNEINKEQQ